MSTFAILRARIESLQQGWSAADFSRARAEILSLLDSLEDQRSLVKADHKPDLSNARLSKRENEVMTMMLEGQRLKEIAARLQISVKTVTTHRSRLMKKLHVDDNLGLYRYGIRNGLISV